jgi:hypothetical protein
LAGFTLLELLPPLAQRILALTLCRHRHGRVRDEKRDTCKVVVDLFERETAGFWEESLADEKVVSACSVYMFNATSKDMNMKKRLTQRKSAFVIPQTANTIQYLHPMCFSAIGVICAIMTMREYHVSTSTSAQTR